MILETIVTGTFGSNCYIVGSEATKEAMVVDPGADADRILATLRHHGLKADLILVTHSHTDHIGAVPEVKKATGARVAMHALTLQEAQGQSRLAAQMFYMITPALDPPDIELGEDDEVKVGDLAFRVLHCPGHTQGHICLYGHGVLLAGDVIFQGSIGRFDFPGGDGRQLLTSIRDKILPLPDDTAIHSGHGPATTLALEKQHNPFIRMLDRILAGEVRI
ncbi:MAG TPA: MBL fold metallo-hydrolase [Dehalococcoidia bacterium]|nr:MBL fold metallo-hydrolase [Dehalococcoidia bacterium]HLB28659.1 MBL fold metallo-hydrolase [Dehalococcoidia bacterium]